MSSKLKTLKDFVTRSEIERINIPIYQRAYSWEYKHVEDFLNDLDHHLKSPDENEYQFLGMMVYVFKENNEKEIEIIDGQQRLTTYYLMCSILYDWMHYEQYREESSIKMNPEQTQELTRTANKVLEEVLYTNESAVARSESSQKWFVPKLYTDNTYKDDKKMTEYFLMDLSKVKNEITTSAHDWTCIDLEKQKNPLTLRTRLFNPANDFDNNKTPKTITKTPINTAKSRPITKNYEQLKEWFETKVVQEKNPKKRFKTIKALVKVLTEKLKVIPFETENHTEAFTLFEVLNDRGMAVSQADLLKNLCIKKGSSYDQKREMYEKWQEQIDDKLTKESQKIPFLRTSHNSRRKFVRKKELYAGYKRRLDALNFEKTKEVFIEHEIGEDVDNFKKCLLEESVEELKIQNAITLLHYTDIDQWKTLALALLRQTGSIESNNLIVDILKEAFEIVFTMKVNKIRFNLIENSFPEYASKLSNGESTLNNVKTGLKVLKNNNNLSYSDAKLNKNVFKENKFSRLILIMYKSTEQDLDRRKLTLEHILPQKAKKSDWMHHFPLIYSTDPEEKDKAETKSVYSIGNMILVEDQHNKSLGNKKFSLKKEKMKSNDTKDIFDSSSDINYRNVELWNQEVIDKREKEIKNTIQRKFTGIKF